MKKINLFPFTLFMLFLEISCEEKTSWELQQADTFPVVDCILTNELKQQEVRLYRSAEKLNEFPSGISGAVIAVSDGRQIVIFTEVFSEPGKYISSIPFRATVGIEYRLTVTLDGRTDTAYAEMTGISPPEAIDIAPKDSFYRVIYHDSPDASMMEVYYDWSAMPDFCAVYGHCEASEVFYTLDNIDAEKIFAPDRQIISFPKKTRIIRKKYSLNPAHQEFIRALLLETEWRGGLFDAEQGNVPTNFGEGMRGWFGACMVLSDTTLIY